MNGWMILWTVTLVVGVVGFIGLLLTVSLGAVGELRLMLEELREDTRESAEHPEILDEAT